MRFAIVGCNDDTCAWAQALARTAHSVVFGSRVGSYRDQLAELFPSMLFTDDWEVLLHDASSDAVVITANGDNEPIRKVAQAGMPLLMVHPAAEAIVAYELNMIQSDTAKPMVTWFPARWQSCFEEIANWTTTPDDSPIGVVEQIVFDRAINSTNKQEVLNQLARDMDWVSQMAGRPTNVHAAASHHTTETLQNLSVTVQADRGVLVRWSAVQAESHAAVRIIGSNGTANLQWPSVDVCQLQLEHQGDSKTSSFEVDNGISRALELLERGDPKLLSADLLATCRTLEVCDTVEISLRRGRTIDLVETVPSEEGAFKGIMAASGCGILLLTIFILLLGSVVEGFVLPTRRREFENRIKTSGDGPIEPAPTRSIWLRLWPVYPFVIFLALQLLVIVARQKKPANQEPGLQKGDGNPESLE